MAIDLKKARDFVYSNGTLWERALFAHLFQEGSLERVQQALLCYKNPDGGWGHALEHDIRCPDSHPLALEFLLAVGRDTGIELGSLLDGTVAWLEGVQQADGSLSNPAAVLDYPHAPWWNGGGQDSPASIVGNLTKLGLISPTLAETTQAWAQNNLSVEQIRANEWLFMNYRPFDYYMNVANFPDVESHRTATIDNIIECAKKAPETQYYGFFTFAQSPDSPVAQRAMLSMIESFLDYLAEAQQDDGHWQDEHGLPQWYPYATITTLLALRRFGRL